VDETISVAGVIQAMPSDFTPMCNSWSSSAANEVILRRETVYLQVTGLNVRSLTKCRSGPHGEGAQSRVVARFVNES